MDLRRLLNTVYRHLSENADRAERAKLDELLERPFDHEIDEAARKRRDYLDRARAIGADKGQSELMDLFGMGKA